MMRANMDINSLGQYTSSGTLGVYGGDGFTDPLIACAAPNQAPVNVAACASTVACDMARWAQELCYTLPEGRGAIQLAIARDGDGNITAADLRVRVRWCDDRAFVDVDTGDCTNGEAAFSNGDLETGTRGGETQFVVEAQL
jgi:hypothetical protein